MRIKFISFSILLTIVFYACEKESVSPIDNIDDGTLINEVWGDGELFYEYTYNAAGLIEEEKGKFHYTRYKYNSKNQLTRSDYYIDERIFSSSSYVLDEAMNREEWVDPGNTELYSYNEYSYNSSGELKRRETNRLATGYESYSEYLYNNNGRIERRTSYHEGKASMYDLFFYDSVGNLIKEERYLILDDGSNELQTRNEYEFDNHPNPYLSFRALMIPGQYTNANNIVKDTYQIFFEVPGFDNNVQVTVNEYSYNEMGYPVQQNDWEYVYY